MSEQTALLASGKRKPERCATSNGRGAPRGGVATEEAEADESCDRFPVARPFNIFRGGVNSKPTLKSWKHQSFLFHYRNITLLNSRITKISVLKLIKFWKKIL